MCSQTPVAVRVCLQLVDNPFDATVFLPRLLPEVERVAGEAADPELRNVASKAMATLKQIQKTGEELGEERRVDNEVRGISRGC